MTLPTKTPVQAAYKTNLTRYVEIERTLDYVRGEGELHGTTVRELLDEMRVKEQESVEAYEDRVVDAVASYIRRRDPCSFYVTYLRQTMLRTDPELATRLFWLYMDYRLDQYTRWERVSDTRRHEMERMLLQEWNDGRDLKFGRRPTQRSAP